LAQIILRLAAFRVMGSVMGRYANKSRLARQKQTNTRITPCAWDRRHTLGGVASAQYASRKRSSTCALLYSPRCQGTSAVPAYFLVRALYLLWNSGAKQTTRASALPSVFRRCDAGSRGQQLRSVIPSVEPELLNWSGLVRRRRATRTLWACRDLDLF
jgi:hypothetical protein